MARHQTPSQKELNIIIDNAGMSSQFPGKLYMFILFHFMILLGLELLSALLSFSGFVVGLYLAYQTNISNNKNTSNYLLL